MRAIHMQTVYGFTVVTLTIVICKMRLQRRSNSRKVLRDYRFGFQIIPCSGPFGSQVQLR